MTPAATSAVGAGAPSSVVVIVLENHSYASIVGNANAPFINGTLIAHGLLEQHYYSVYPNSGGNYLAMTAGITDAAMRLRNEAKVALVVSKGRRP